MEEGGSRESVLNNDWSLKVLKIETQNKKYMQHTEAEKKQENAILTWSLHKECTSDDTWISAGDAHCIFPTSRPGKQ